MGEVIPLAGRQRQGGPRAERRRKVRATTSALLLPVTFAFDLSSPFTYLAAERAERLLPAAEWVPVIGNVLGDFDGELATARAAQLRIPLLWPEPGDAVAAMRAAAFAARHGKAPGFVLAASRLAFCGGFELNDPEVLAEAAVAAGLGLEACLGAARDESLDGPMTAEARRLVADGADRLPAMRVGDRLFCGEDQLAAAAVFARERPAPLALAP
jgi:2-hydroxychromene-2-carboxylate isomerase